METGPILKGKDIPTNALSGEQGVEWLDFELCGVSTTGVI